MGLGNIAWVFLLFSLLFMILCRLESRNYDKDLEEDFLSETGMTWKEYENR